jgi:putative oxidoreductase
MTPFTTNHNVLTLVGRVLIVWLYLTSGFGKITGFEGTVKYIAGANVPLPEIAAALAIFAEVVLGLMVLLGFHARLAALGMIVFTVVITFIFHHYWDLPPAQAYMQKLHFLKNMGIVGGMLGIVGWGPGGWSLDARRAQVEPRTDAALNR